MMRIIIALMMLLAAAGATAQRHITPQQPGKPAVTRPATEKPADLGKLAHYTDSEGRVVLVDTVSGTEFPDTTILRIPRMQYPLLHTLSVGVNIWDPAMRIFGQKYGGADAAVTLGLHNRYFPTFEAGLSVAHDTPSGSNFTFRSPLAAYFKIGADYNFFYNSNADYKLMAGVRYGITSFRYYIDNVTVDNGYWDSSSHFDIPGSTSLTGYFELLLGVRVKIAGPFSMGWAFKYHTIIHQSSQQWGLPMIIPGYGKRSGSITGAFSLIYTFTLNKPAPAAVE